MEATSIPQERDNPSPLPSPTSNGGTSVSSSSNNSTYLSPKPISRSEPNPYPTTFVQADTSNFKQVVQMLTGSAETAKKAVSKPSSDFSTAAKSSIPPMKAPQKKQQGFKLYERRNQLKNSIMINPLVPRFVNSGGSSPRFSPRKAEILSPSLLDFPKLTLSPVTPLNDDPFNNSSNTNQNSPLMGVSSSEEERAITEKGYYFHPSPNATRYSEPQLLPLFPVTSPRVFDSNS